MRYSFQKVGKDHGNDHNQSQALPRAREYVDMRLIHRRVSPSRGSWNGHELQARDSDKHLPARCVVHDIERKDLASISRLEVFVQSIGKIGYFVLDGSQQSSMDIPFQLVFASEMGLKIKRA